MTRNLALVALACGACTAAHPGAESWSPGDTSSVFTSALDAGSTPIDAGSAVDAAADAAVEAAVDAAVPPADSTHCPVSVVLGNGTAEALADADHTGFSIPTNGLTAAWPVSGGIHYSDRGSLTGAWGAAKTIGGNYGAGRVALTSDGLGLVSLRADGQSFKTWTRASRSGSFAAAVSDPTASITADAVAPGLRFANPLLARGDTFLLYDVVTSTGYVTYVSTRFRTSEPFAGGAPYLEEILGKPGTHLVVTQASDDLRTFFVWDEDAQRSRIISVNAASELVFDEMLGAMRDVQADDFCTMYWFASGSPLGVYRALPR